MYFIGIDGGGTNSRLIAADRDFNILKTSVSGATNLCSNPYETVKGHIAELIDGLDISDCSGICIGSAGIDTKETENLMIKLLKELGFAKTIKAVNDGEIILAAETKGRAGICIISGTGSIAFGMNENGEFLRAGGLGHIIDDGGSAYRIGMDAIKYSLMAADGRGNETSLLKRIIEFFKLNDITEILDIVYTEDFKKQEIAKLSLIVAEEAAAGDSVASDIEANAAADLFKLAEALIKRAELQKPTIALSGSVILNNEHIRKIFENKINDRFLGAQISGVSEKPEMGAIYLAMS